MSCRLINKRTFLDLTVAQSNHISAELISNIARGWQHGQLRRPWIQYGNDANLNFLGICRSSSSGTGSVSESANHFGPLKQSSRLTSPIGADNAFNLTRWMRVRWEDLALKSSFGSAAAVVTNLATASSMSFIIGFCYHQLSQESRKIGVQHHIRKHTTRHSCNEPSHESPPTILACSPNNSSPPFVLDTSYDSSNTHLKRLWSCVWRWYWWDSRHKSSGAHTEEANTTWLQQIKKNTFVFVRGAEILLRLSPLFVLAPIAMLVSYTDRVWKRHVGNYSACLKNGDGFSSMTTESQQGKSFRHCHDSNYISLYDIQNNGQTWASTLVWKYALYTLHSLGPAFVKLGQWAATRRDLFPVHICHRLSELHDMANTHDWKYTHESLVKAFGVDYESKGLIVTRNQENSVHCSGNGQNLQRSVRNDGIIGSGSVAQVHRGTLTTKTTVNNNRSHVETRTKTVAIKVLHPNIQKSVEKDLDLLQNIASLIDHFIPLELIKMLSLPRAVKNFSDIMKRQVDLRIEGNNLRTFRENFSLLDNDLLLSGRQKRNGRLPTVDFPRPEQEWISECVLVEDYAGDDVAPISWYLEDDSPTGLETRRKLAGDLLRAFMKMVFVDNFVHADLHPGNILVRATRNEENRTVVHYTIIFLDAGITVSLSPNNKKNLHDLFRAVVLNDGYTAGSLMVDRAQYERCSSTPGGKHAFATGVAAIVSKFHDRRSEGLTLGAVRIGELLGRVLDLCQRYGVEIDPAMAGVVVSMLVLEGLGRSLDPNLNLMKASLPFILGKGTR